MEGWVDTQSYPELCREEIHLLPYMETNHEFWVFQPAAQSLYWLSYTDSKQFYLEIKNCENSPVIIFCVPLLLTLS
jgi:hypothetical protein